MIDSFSCISFDLQHLILTSPLTRHTDFPVPGSPTTLAYGRAWGRIGGLCFIIFLISSILSSFSNASSVGRRLDILKYCGLGCYNTAVVVSYYRRCAC